MRVLVTNDDGYTAPGLTVLANRLVAAGYEVIVAAPLRQQSGGSASLGRVVDGATISWQEISPDVLPGVRRIIAIDAPPALAVKAILGGAFGERPDIVISGINGGWNTGGSTLHSGTLGAALTACSLGLRAAAISCGRKPNGNLQTAAEVAVSAVEVLRNWTSPVAFNINVPNAALADIKGVRYVEVGRQGILDVDVVMENGELRFKLVPRIPESDSKSDGKMVLDGFVSVSVLNGRYEHLHDSMMPTGLDFDLESRIMSGV